MPRRSSNNPFDTTNNNDVPTYQNNEETNKYYNSDEKRREQQQQQQQQRQARSPPPPPQKSLSSRPLHSRGELPPPSYDDVVPKSKQSSQYPNEKSSSQSQPAGHRSRSRSELSSQDRARLEEKERERARRHRERERDHREHHSSGDSSRRHRSSKDESSSSKHRSSRSSKPKEQKPKQPAKNVDTIDKLDVTGLFGVGFHHDGPFDACTPHRNVNVKAAPVMAFPVDGANNSIRGGNNASKNSTLNYIQGVEDDDDNLYTISVSNNTYQAVNSSNSTINAIKTDSKRFSNFDATGKVSKIHGETTLGLGSSTFLDGAPASKTSQVEDASHKAGALGRKKSSSHKILGEEVSAVRFEQENTDFYREKEEKEGNSLLRRVKSLRVGRK
ncbi:hypothetical protein WICPIJ_004746 [Wickerhamomyces pijperi]|uniref:Uncharacterized protein n=1 Tax=Wickerhamomyces pijperi TaxID=599730 RepID=A0A9P8TMG2_WICPI|nr:hypothetical protein WICPIJ_004746 [Wickerhamomyces pijperi]